nr:MAG TPA: YlbE-like protein [Caudoviricetes sp.]
MITRYFNDREKSRFLFVQKNPPWYNIFSKNIKLFFRGMQ